MDYVYLWADGIHLNIRLEEHKLCLLVTVGSAPTGARRLIALADGYRESAESWADLLRDCARRGMQPHLEAGRGPQTSGRTGTSRDPLHRPRLTVIIGPGHEVTDMYYDLARIREVDEDGVLLVGPDKHIGWRSMTLPATRNKPCAKP